MSGSQAAVELTAASRRNTLIESIVEAPAMGAIEIADSVGLQVTAVQTAMELDLFTIIASGRHCLEEISKATGCNDHGLRTLLDALCPIGLLRQADGRYELTATAEAYLVRSSPAYCVPIYLAWLQNRARFIEFVRTGRAGLDLTAPEAEDLWVAYAAPARLQWPDLAPRAREQWAATGITPATFPGARILDLGCGAGYKTFSLLQADPSAHVTALDRPKVLGVAEDIARAMGVSDQVTFTSNDVAEAFFDESFDLVLFGSLLHYYDDAAATDLLRTARHSLYPAGIVAINARVVDEERSDSVALLAAIDVSNCAPYAQHRTFREYQQLLVSAGFDQVSQATPSMIFGRKTEH
jgi:2-polyprenyl-3-methyl-5-hydroxy-6-metoxy-1,4-benzoquinol methylase